MLRPPRAARLAAAVVVAVLVAAAAGCTGDDEAPAPGGGAAPTPSPTPLAEVATREVALARGPFCERVPATEVEAALGGPSDAADAWENGDRIAVPGGRDVAHEYGCAWRGPEAAQARAWVFAPPVTRAQAGALTRAAERARGCRPAPGAPAFGAPSTALICRVDSGIEASYRGLFGDAWLTCTVQVEAVADEQDLLDRTGRWCVAALGAASA